MHKVKVKRFKRPRDLTLLVAREVTQREREAAKIAFFAQLEKLTEKWSMPRWWGKP